MSTQLENQTFDNSYFQQCLPQIYRSVLKDFKKIVHSHILLHILFISLIIGEMIGFLPFIQKSAMAALGISLFFLTIFSYLVIFIYSQTRKPERLLRLKTMFLDSCRRHISIPVGEVHHHLTIADALLKLASYLEDFEKNFYKLPTIAQFLNKVFNKFSSYFYWKDVFHLKKLLLSAAVEEHLKQIRITPTDLEIHASLAATYVAQSKIYRLKGRNRKTQGLFVKDFRSSSHLAIEEFEILNSYAPNDPWIHEQLAIGYQELDMPDYELKEVELLAQLRPHDKEILFRLGELYFQQGMNAKGLRIYEELKQLNFKKSEALISYYGILKNNADELFPIYSGNKN